MLTIVIVKDCTSLGGIRIDTLSTRTIDSTVARKNGSASAGSARFTSSIDVGSAHRRRAADIDTVFISLCGSARVETYTEAGIVS